MSDMARRYAEHTALAADKIEMQREAESDKAETERAASFGTPHQPWPSELVPGFCARCGGNLANHRAAT